MANFIQPGAVIDYTNTGSAKIAAGDVVSLTSRIGVAACDIIAGEKGSVSVSGVWEIDKTASLAISLGDAVYFSTSTKKITKTNSDIPAGFAVAAAAAADATVRVKIG